MLARSLRDRIGKPLVLTYHTKFDIDIARDISSKLLQEEAKKFLVENISDCDEVWTVSRGAGENLRSLGYQGDYIVMPNGVDFPRGRVSDSLIAEVTAGYDLPDDAPLFLFVGRMMWYKGIRIILDALKSLRESGQVFRMVFVGGGGDKKEIVAYARDLGLQDVVFFVEPIHDRSRIRAWYCRADLFLFPSTFDTNGLVVREAAACSLPSVLIEGSCAAEDAEDGVSGFLIAENAASMAEKLSELCKKPELVRAVGKGALDRLYISWEEAVANACRRYELVIENYRAGRYPPHTGLSDDLIHAIAQAMEGYSRSREKQKAAMRELGESSRRLWEDFLTEGQKRMDDYRAEQRFRSELESGQHQLTTDLGDTLDDIAKLLDRFL
jgi:glycosyltransferase involved in cell wall biosynthesis